MSSAWRALLRDLVEMRTGIRMREENAPASTERFVNARVGELGLKTARDYVALLSAEPDDGPEFRRLVAVVAIGETYFFRDEDQFASMSEIIAERSAKLVRPLQAWCACVSTGQEAYTLAMVAEKLGVPIRITGSDINVLALDVAREGQFGNWTVRHVSTTDRTRFFTTTEHGWKVKDRLKRPIEFVRHNVLRDPPLKPPIGDHWDLVLCRHAMVYFAKPTVEKVARNLGSMMSGESWLFLGASESLHGLQVPFHPVRWGKRVGYQKNVEGQPIDAMLDRLIGAPANASYDRMTIGNLAGVSGTTSLFDKPVPPRKNLARTPATNASGLPERDHTYDAALGLLFRGNLDEARVVLETVVKVDPNHLVARLTLGNLFLQAHEFEKALEQYVKAQEREPLWPEPHYLQGVAWRKMGDLDGAVRALRRALFLEPRYWPASFLLAGVYDRLGRQGDRRRELLRSLEALGDGANVDVKRLFVSFISQVSTLHLSPPEVATACRRQLETLG